MAQKILFILLILIINFGFFLPFWGWALTILPNPEYLALVQQRIGTHLFYPWEAKFNGWEGTVVVRFTLLRDGQLKEIDIVKSSGYALLDKAAVSAVKNASPYPSLEYYHKAEELEIILPINYAGFKKEEVPPAPIEETPALQEEISLLIKELEDKKERGLPTTEEEYTNLIKEVIDYYLPMYPEIREITSEGVVKVEFMVTKEGKISNLKIVESSGDKTLDNLALRIIKEIAPLPSPVKYLQKDRITVIIPFEFKVTPRKEEVERELKRKIPFEAKSEVFHILRTKDYLLKLYRIGATNSQPLKVSEGQLKLAQHKINEALRMFFPFLGVEYKEDWGQAITDKYKSKNYGLKLEHILYDHNQRSDTFKREKLNFEVAESNYEKERNNLLFEILKAYYVLCAEKEILTFWKSLKKEEIDRDFELAEILKEGRLITQIEYLKICSFIAKVHSELLAQENKYTLALANLKKTLGIPPGEEIPELEFAKLGGDITLKENVEEYINTGLEERPEIALWKKSTEATELGYKIAKNEKKPKLLFESFWGKSGEAFGWQELDLATTWNVVGKVVWLFGGSSSELSLQHEKTMPTTIAEVSNKVETNSISFKTNILDKIKYYSEVTESKVAMDQSLDELEKIAKDIAWEIQEGSTAYLEGKKEVEMYKEEEKLRLQELELKKELFQAGEIQFSELIEDKIKLTQTKSLSARGKLKLYQGAILLDKGTGFHTKVIEEL